MIDLCTTVNARDLEIDDLVDFSGDEYCDNPEAEADYAKILDIAEFYDSDDQLCLILTTTQGIYQVHSLHIIKLKVQD